MCQGSWRQAGCRSLSVVATGKVEIAGERMSTRDEAKGVQAPDCGYWGVGRRRVGLLPGGREEGEEEAVNGSVRG